MAKKALPRIVSAKEFRKAHDQFLMKKKKNTRDTSFVMNSRAPLRAIKRHQKRLGRNLPWVSSPSPAGAASNTWWRFHDEYAK